jgi:D-arabinose 1-dehydrogenase-like Zn-dependent alcohol dehydrogenase
MHSWQIIDWGKPLEARDYPDPVPTGTEVVLKVDACGVCHSDLHIQDGYFDLGGGEAIRIADRGMKLPFTMGHEVVGTVMALGPDAAGVAVGDRRIVFPWIGCGQCAVCRKGEELLCLTPRIVGTWKDGGYSDRVLVPHPRYLVDYTGIDTKLAGTYACSGVTAYSAIRKCGELGPDDSLLLLGAGGVGLSALHIAKAISPARLIVADVDPAKREQAQRDGADVVIDNGQADSLAQLRSATGGGVTAAMDFVGRPQTAKFAMDGLRKGGTLVVVGLYGDRMGLPVALLPLRMLSLKGSYVGTLAEFKELIELVKSGMIPPIPVQGRPLDGVNTALDDLRSGRVVGRVVVQP